MIARFELVQISAKFALFRALNPAGNNKKKSEITYIYMVFTRILLDNGKQFPLSFLDTAELY